MVPPHQIEEWKHHRTESLWQYAPLLPLGDPTRAVSLGEGQTPLVRAAALDKAYGCPRVFLKDETRNPTWSHKDRYHTVSVSMAKALGFGRVATASTGNHGISAAAYAARARLDCIVFLASETSPSMWYLAGLYGARAVVTSFDGREELLAAVAAQPHWFVAGALGQNGPGDPFGIEGYKTIAFELIRQAAGTPDAILVPVGSGDLLRGLWKGFQEAHAIGMVTHTPRLFACQPAGANVVERAMQDGGDTSLQLETAYSIATSTREKSVSAAALQAVCESGGRPVSVTESEILDAIRWIGREGLCVEPASALTVACLRRLLDTGPVAPSEQIVCVLTSAGIKWPELLPEVSRPPVRVLPTRVDLERVLNELAPSARKP